MQLKPCWNTFTRISKLEKILYFTPIQFSNRFSSFNEADFENGYSRNLLWRLWHASRALEMKHLHDKCSEVFFLSFDRARIR